MKPTGPQRPRRTSVNIILTQQRLVQSESLAACARPVRGLYLVSVDALLILTTCPLPRPMAWVRHTLCQGGVGGTQTKKQASHHAIFLEI